MSWLRRLLGGADAPAASTDANAAAPRQDERRASLLEQAVARHRQGDLAGAESLYRRLLDNDPDDVAALHLLGSLYGQRGDLAEAAAKLERALSLAPDDPDIHADLANLRRLEGRPEDARRLLEQAAALQPENAARHYALAGLLIALGEHAAALEPLERVIELEAGHAAAHNDLGALYIETGRYEAARRALETAARLDPGSPSPRRNLAALCSKLGDPGQAVRWHRQALELAPDDDGLRSDLAEALLRSGDAEAALDAWRELVRRGPGNAAAWHRLAETAATLAYIDEAIAAYRRVLEIEPERGDVLNDLGVLLSGRREFEAAADVLERAVEIAPELHGAYHNLGGTCHMQGRFEEAVEAYARALEIDPLNMVTLSNLIAISNYRDRSETGNLDELHARYRRSLAPERVRASGPPVAGDPSPGRLRVGYVSADFRQHSVAYFIEPVIAGHDRRRFEVFCYSDVDAPDAKTERFRQLADHWRDISGDDHETVAARIRADRIDLLVDLGGHFRGNRLPVFGQRPAPVQLSYLGYPATTALPEMDYRLTDAVADPPGKSDREHTEVLLRLPEVFLSYLPSTGAPDVCARPAVGAAVTFGSFNELPKVSPAVIRAWGRILAAVPGARLLLKATALGDAGTRARVLRRFEAAGVEAGRVELAGRTATLDEHLAFYGRVDVALDTFPYNGTTTTCEAIYMGVPVVTLAGAEHAGRVGASLLGSLGLHELVCEAEERYVRVAVGLARDPERRSAYRASLRQRLLESPLGDVCGFVASLEAAYSDMCRGRTGRGRGNVQGGAFPASVEGALELHTRHGFRMVLPDDLEQLTAYVLLEQEDWFEDETDFVRRFLLPGMRSLDVGANFGVYSLLAAARTGLEGRVWSFEPASMTARWLRANAAVNEYDSIHVLKLALGNQNGTLRLSLQSGAETGRLVGQTSATGRGEPVEVRRLDDCARNHAIGRVDFVKLDAEGAEKLIIDGGRRFFAEESPLVMFEIKSGHEVDVELARRFTEIGYRVYRLIPGLGILAPFDFSRPPDAYALNMFACKEDREHELAGRELLVAPEAGVAGAVADDDIWDFFLAREFAAARVDGWRSRLASRSGESGALWMRLLGLCVAAFDDDLPAARRKASLESAWAMFADGIPQVSRAARLNTRARIGWALGFRRQAVEALGELVALGGDLPAAFDWPFLPASPAFDHLAPGDRLAAWGEACALDQLERLKSFSSYFLGGEDLESLERIRRTGFQRPEMERRRLLVRLRHNMPITDLSRDVLARRGDNLNPTFWAKRTGSGGKE